MRPVTMRQPPPPPPPVPPPELLDTSDHALESVLKLCLRPYDHRAPDSAILRPLPTATPRLPTDPLPRRAPTARHCQYGLRHEQPDINERDDREYGVVLGL